MFSIKHFSDFDAETQKLLESSITARETAYAPYSKFKIGAALLCDDGTIFLGCNVENSSYPLCTCAERTAVVKAVSEGFMHFKCIAVSGAFENNNQFITPCGSCRQTIAEFNTKSLDIKIYLVKPDKSEILETSIKSMLPLDFRFD